jgi:hypothetical protein
MCITRAGLAPVECASVFRTVYRTLKVLPSSQPALRTAHARAAAPGAAPCSVGLLLRATPIAVCGAC